LDSSLSQKSKEPKRKPGQLDLFSAGRVISLNQLSRFEEAFCLMTEETKGQGHLSEGNEEGDSIADAYCT